MSEDIFNTKWHNFKKLEYHSGKWYIHPDEFYSDNPHLSRFQIFYQSIDEVVPILKGVFSKVPRNDSPVVPFMFLEAISNSYTSETGCNWMNPQ